jgi:leucyl/phenylalanyl-tRNA--protein transferase
MSVFILNKSIEMPSPIYAESDGLVAIGGDLKPERIINAYKMGIFPWYNEGEEILWWSPDPRFVLFPDELKVSKSMATLIRKEKFTVSYNTVFDKVIQSCKTVDRKEQDGTWINNEMVEAYNQLFEMGIAKSVEVWSGNELVGGVYGLQLGKVFFGESMFTKESNASKFGFIHLVKKLKKEGIVLIDCQQETAHLRSLGAIGIERANFLKLLHQNS